MSDPLLYCFFTIIHSVTAPSPCLTNLAEHKELLRIAKTPVDEHYFENAIPIQHSITEIDKMEIWTMF